VTARAVHRVARAAIVMQLAALHARTLQAQTRPATNPNLYTTLGDLRGVSRVPGGVLLRAERGNVLVESVAGVGVRVRVRFGALPVASPRRARSPRATRRSR